MCGHGVHGVQYAAHVIVTGGNLAAQNAAHVVHSTGNGGNMVAFRVGCAASSGQGVSLVEGFKPLIL
jgi:hypothetical protein